MEVCHFSPDSSISKSQPELLASARQAQVQGRDVPIGMVLESGVGAPKAMNDGIVMNSSRDLRMSSGRRFMYWALAKNGDFYSLMSLSEDSVESSRDAIWLEECIVRAAETLIHCANLYKALGLQPNAHIEIAVRYGGVSGRMLRPAPGSLRFLPLLSGATAVEDEVPIPPVALRLGDLDAQMIGLVKKLCEPLFVLFDFASFKDEIYEMILYDFLPFVQRG